MASWALAAFTKGKKGRRVDWPSFQNTVLGHLFQFLSENNQLSPNFVAYSDLPMLTVLWVWSLDRAQEAGLPLPCDV